MKAGRTHRVPLSREAVTVLRKLAKLRTGAHVFPGLRVSSRALSARAILRALREAGETKATVHGFRSAFRDWAAERTNYPRDVAEMALAHSIGDRIEAAYRRGELMEKRRAMMEAVGAFSADAARIQRVADGKSGASIIPVAQRHRNAFN